MEKKEVLMKNWHISKWRGEYNLSGVGDNHPTLGKNIYISYTSHLIDYKVENDILYYETKNTKYKCPLKYIETDFYENTKEDSIKSLKDSLEDNKLDDIIRLEINLSKQDYSNEYTKYVYELTKSGKIEIAEYNENEKQRLLAKVKDKENSIYIEVSKIDSGDMASYNITIDGKNYLDTVKPYVHSGMFQDSILYTVPGVLDFRYFPQYNGMESYHWNDTIKHIYLENCLDAPFTFNGKVINPGCVECFENTERNEGLLSPDVVDGSNFFNNKDDER